jgi:integrase
VLHQSKLLKYPPGRHPDGKNLYVRITRIGRGSFYYRSNKHEEGLGPIDVVTLAEAREKAAAIRKQEHEGKDPKVERENARRDQEIKNRTNGMTLAGAWQEFIDTVYAGRDPRTVKQLQWRFNRFVPDHVRRMPLGKFTTNTLLDDSGIGLSRLFNEKFVSAKRLRGELGRMFNFCMHRGYPLFEGRNPAAWEGHLQYLLPNRRPPVTNQPSLPYQDVPRFMVELRAYESGSMCIHGRLPDRSLIIGPRLNHTTVALLIEFIVLTGERLSEARCATFDEFDFQDMVWTVPWQRLKTGEHDYRDRYVPIVPSVLRVLDEMQRRRTDHSDNALVFPSPRGGAYGMSTCSTFIVRTLKWEELVRCENGTMRHPVLHGFRSTIAEFGRANGFADHVMEHQLDHAEKGETKGAYFRSRSFDERRRLLTMWGEHCDRPTPADGTNVAQFNEARKRRRAS